MKNKKNFRRISIVTSGLDDKHIKSLSDLIKTNENDNIFIHNLFNRDETFTLLKQALSKYEKNSDDIFVITKYLKLLKNFMNLLYSGITEDYDINSLLNNIASNMKCEEYFENTFLIKVGEIGSIFYIILSGSVYVLVPKVYNVKMSERQYLFHLKLLYNYNEEYLFEKTLLLNNSFFPQLDYDTVKIDVEELKQGRRIDIDIDVYISNINSQNIIEDENEEIYNLRIMGYYKVTELNKGNSFGEIALLNEDQQRTASIFIKENSIFGILSSFNFKNSISDIQDKIKKKNINFILNYPLFEPLNIPYFTNNYWNFFIHKKLEKDEFIFKKGNIRNEIFFIEEGEIKIVSPNITYKKINEYISYLSKASLKKSEMENIGRSENIIITYIKNGEILGTNDLLYNNTYFCSGICESKIVSYFSINIEIMENIMSTFKQIKVNWDNLNKNKTNLMIDRLNTIKKTYMNSLFGEFRNHEESKVIHDNSKESKNVKYSFDCLNPNLEKKYSKFNLKNCYLKSFNLSEYKKKKDEMKKKHQKRNITQEYLPYINFSPQNSNNMRFFIKKTKTEFNTSKYKKNYKSTSQSIEEEDNNYLKKKYLSKEDKISHLISSRVYEENFRKKKKINILDYIIVDKEKMENNKFKKNIRLEILKKKVPPNFLKNQRIILNFKKHFHAKSQSEL